MPVRVDLPMPGGPPSSTTSRAPTAAEDPVELADAGREPRRALRADLAQGHGARRGGRRPAGQRRRAARGRDALLHERVPRLAPRHCPRQRASAWPQSEQTNVVVGRAIGVSQARPGPDALAPPAPPPPTRSGTPPPPWGRPRSLEPDARTHLHHPNPWRSMKRLVLTATALAALAVPAAAPAKTADKNLVQTAQSGRAVQDAGQAGQGGRLAPTLSGSAKYTVFAPTDAAFKKVRRRR